MTSTWACLVIAATACSGDLAPSIDASVGVDANTYRGEDWGIACVHATIGEVTCVGQGGDVGLCVEHGQYEVNLGWVELSPPTCELECQGVTMLCPFPSVPMVGRWQECYCETDQP